MDSKKYSLLPKDESGFNDEKTLLSKPDNESRKLWRSRSVVLISTALVISLAFNLVCVHYLAQTSRRKEPLSTYAHLARDIPTRIVGNSTFDSPDRAIEDAAWTSLRVRPANGVVTLADSHSEVMGLPHSMRWPWDKDRGVYILASSHEMHCLSMIRDTVNEAHDGKTVHMPHAHIMHCLDLLRRSIMCNADDTPLYTGRLHDELSAEHPQAGVGTVRMCRDWDKLQAWAKERSACYDPYHRGDPTVLETERYKFCPDGAKPWEQVEHES